MRIALADNVSKQNGNRMGARAVIVEMIGQQHKKDAIVLIKKYLSDNTKNGLRGIDVGDCFSQDLIQRAKTLTKYGAMVKRSGKIARFRVINKNGDAVLQTSQKGQPYRDDSPSEEDLCRFMEREDSDNEHMDVED